MAVKRRVEQLEEARKAEQPPEPFDVFSIYPGSDLPEEVREAMRGCMYNGTEADHQELLANYPEHKEGIRGVIMDLSL